MKIYISADIEGVTGVTSWSETEKGNGDFGIFASQMTKEVKAACDGAVEAGVAEIYVKDAHDSGINIDIKELPEYVKLQSGWAGDPMCMVSGLDESFDGVIFIGYHSRAGSGTSPLAHTLDTGMSYIKINGVYASEFLINAYAAALYNVPVIFVSGDKGLMDEVKVTNGNIKTLAVKEGIGNCTVNIHPRKAIKDIKTLVKEVLLSDYSLCRLTLPDTFNIELAYERHEKAYRNSFYPGAKLIEPRVISYTTDNYYEVLRLFHFLT